MFELKLNQTFMEINVLGRVYRLTILKMIIGSILAWIISAFVLCSCCTYTLTDVIDLAYDKAFRLMGNNDKISLRIQNIYDKTCSCKSPWYSPCVVWGNKQIKEDSCNKEGSCEDNNIVDSADETECATGSCVGSSSVNKCKNIANEKVTQCESDFNNLTSDGKFNEPFASRGGNRDRR